MTIASRWTSVCLTVALAGCGARASTLPSPSPAEIPALEAELAADPDDLATALRLAAAYREAERGGEADALVAGMLDRYPDDPGLQVMAGLLAEDAGSWSEAGERYEVYLEAAPGGPLREEVERRLELVRREALRAQVRASLAREAELADASPDPRAVGVFPFAHDGDDPSWDALGPALAELLVTDLSITGRLRVLERVHVQTLLDELALAESGLVEPATAARSGRLLGSGHVVQGRFRIDDGNRIGVDAALVEVGPPGSERVEPLTRSDALERLLDLEKELALDLYAELGVELTPAERRAVGERQTTSVQALLSFGRGLTATDAGDFTGAEEHFTQAAELDPGFTLARERARAAGRLAGARAAAAGTRLSAQAARLARQRDAVRALRDAPVSVRQQMLQRLGDRKRAVLAEVLGQDRLGTPLLLELFFRRPGGSP